MYRRILVPLDGSPLAEAALAQLPHLAGSDTEIVLVRVVGNEPEELPPSVVAPASATTNFAGVVPPAPHHPGHDEPESEYTRRQDIARRYLDEKAASLALDSRRSFVVLSDSDAARAIAAQATSSNADLIVMSTHGRSGVVRLVLGSVAEKVLRSTKLPLLLVRPG
jgi:nucleotide-binding universal stress UspA family protein